MLCYAFGCASKSVTPGVVSSRQLPPSHDEPIRRSYAQPLARGAGPFRVERGRPWPPAGPEPPDDEPGYRRPPFAARRRPVHLGAPRAGPGAGRSPHTGGPARAGFRLRPHPPAGPARPKLPGCRRRPGRGAGRCPRPRRLGRPPAGGPAAAGGPPAAHRRPWPPRRTS